MSSHHGLELFVHSDEEFGWTDGKNGRHAREFGSNRSLDTADPDAA
jgi:hypothetical protein